MDPFLVVLWLLIAGGVLKAYVDTRHYERSNRDEHESFCDEANERIARDRQQWADELEDLWRAA